MTKKIRVVVVDDHRLFREGLVEVLGTFDDIEVVGEGASSSDAIAIVRREKPDVILLDLDMPAPTGSYLSGVIAAETITAKHPSTQVVIVTIHDDPAVVRKLLEAGASGYVTKTVGREELHSTITSAARGQDAVLVRVSRATVNEIAGRSVAQPSQLTPREMVVLRELAREGEPNRTIAMTLGISEPTLKRHLATVYSKLGVQTRIQAVLRAEALGLLN
ncbi:MAG TPA: response regulator transcription factor [Marmoricola sp.]|nr:response regulator transcription factor [Marmoricola sp.]